MRANTNTTITAPSYNRVLRVTPEFWLIKLMAVTMGETAADYLGVQMGFGLTVMDRLLPGIDGLSVVKALRASDITAPVLFLTAINGLDDRVEGLESGGDDYLVKPFALSELLARINALARRLPVPREKTTPRLWDLELGLVRHSCKRGAVVIELLPREFKLLEYLMRNEDRNVTRAMLLERVWDFHLDPKTSVVETHISRLRA